jgi:hypothetical protein
MALLSGDRRFGIRASLWAFTAICWLCAGCPLRAQQRFPYSEEYRVKAAFLFNFGKFVDWPGADADSRQPLVIAVYGTDPFGPLLEQTIRDRMVRGRRVTVRRPNRVEDLLPCQILFVASSEKKRLARILEAVEGAGVLVVGEMDGFLRLGGMVALSVDYGKVRFEINGEAVQRSGLKIDAKLLLLAKAPRAAR